MWLALDVVVSVIALALLFRVVRGEFHNPSTRRMALALAIGYPVVAICLLSGAFLEVGYTAFGAVLYGAILAGLQMLGMAALGGIAVLAGVRSHRAG